MKLSNIDKVRALLHELEIINERTSMFEKIDTKDASEVIYQELRLLHDRKVAILNELKEL